MIFLFSRSAGGTDSDTQALAANLVYWWALYFTRLRREIECCFPQNCLFTTGFHFPRLKMKCHFRKRRPNSKDHFYGR